MALIFAVFTPSVSAQGLHIQDDPVKINFGTADFGSTPHALGSPVGSGSVSWDFFPGGILQAQATVNGVLFLDSLDPGCARLTIEFHSSTGAIIETRHKDVCVTVTGHNANNSTNQLVVKETLRSPDLVFVDLRTNSVVNNQVVSSSPKFESFARQTQKQNININGDNADFGNGLHAGGGPTGNGFVRLSRNSGFVTGEVSGTLYYDSLFSEGCAQIIIDFENSAGTALSTKTIKKCGPGGNANDSVNKKSVDETLDKDALFKIRLRVGQVLTDGSFIRVKKKLCDFNGCKDI
jgi:hypothetical protein